MSSATVTTMTTTTTTARDTVAVPGHLLIHNHAHSPNTPTSIATTQEQQQQQQQQAPPTSGFSFLSLPAELRLQIYTHLLFPSSSCTTTTSSASSPPPTLQIRTLDPLLSPPPSTHPVRRTTYLTPIRPAHSRTGVFPAYAPTTYTVLRPSRRGCCRCSCHAPGAGDDDDGKEWSYAHLAPLARVCRQVHDEATELFYGRVALDFSAAAEAVGPFLADLTPWVRARVRAVRMVRRMRVGEWYGLPPRGKEEGVELRKRSDLFERQAWRQACGVLAGLAEGKGGSLRRLEVGVKVPVNGTIVAVDEAAEPLGLAEWERWAEQGVLAGLAAADLCGDLDMRWVAELSRVTGLREVRVCVMPDWTQIVRLPGRQLEVWMRFARAVGRTGAENGLEEWLRGVMVKEGL